ncbi:MAG: hypothetical protein ACI92E_002454, partial [Oceanicoccus sp.]
TLEMVNAHSFNAAVAINMQLISYTREILTKGTYASQSTNV